MVEMDPLSNREPLDVLAEDFCRRHRRGESPQIAEYVAKYPELADEIRQLLPTLRWMEDLKTTFDEGSQSSTQATAPRQPSWIGEYRVIREIGRGGMGIVYEAQQPSLDRRVAVKVLPHGLFSDDRQRKRFEHEARAAARLHHTNIVPIFGVGEHDGVPFYSMQYIPGQSLDRIIAAVRTASSGKHEPDETQPEELDSTAKDPQSEGPNVTMQLLHRVARDRRQTAVGHSSPSTHGVMNRRTVSVLYRTVAAIGAQVADALQYAHQHGVLHRDIKPSNLLLDDQGTVWVTDFGLAKVVAEPSLTQAGDIVGTVRYMAPEMFQGNADARSDIYSLGLTLYEIVAGKPAFDRRARAADIAGHLSGVSPARLTKIEPSVPTDLATIIHKAIEHEPALRYQSANELHEDLRRFLADQPILARRTPIAVQLIRWCRKNPVIASLTGTVVCLLLTGLVAVGLVSIHLNRLVGQRQRAELVAKSQLFESLGAQARASLFSGRSGQRFETLAAIQQAAHLRTELGLDEHASRPLRDRAISAMTLPDVAPYQVWQHDQRDVPLDSIDFDPTLEHFAQPTSNGILICRTQDRQIVRALPDSEGIPVVTRFSPNGKMLAVNYEGPQGDDLTIWEWESSKRLLELPDGLWKLAVDFSPDSHRIAIGRRSGTVEVYDLATRQQTAHTQVGETPFAIRWSPDGDRIAISDSTKSEVAIWDPVSNQFIDQLKHPKETTLHGLDWHPSGKQLAVAVEDAIWIWRLSDVTKPYAKLTGQSWLVHDVRYHPKGDYLVSHGWAGKTHLWNLDRMQSVMSIDGHFSRFNPRGDNLAFRTGSRLGIWRVATADECETLYPLPPKPTVGENPMNVHASFSPHYPLLASSGESVVLLWDSRDYRRLVAMSLKEEVTTAQFHPVHRELWVSSKVGLMRYPVEAPEADRNRITFGPPKSVLSAERSHPGTLAISADGTTIAVVLKNEGRVLVFDRKTMDSPGYEPKVVSGSTQMAHLDVSPDGRWIVAGRMHEPGFEIWSTRSQVQEAVSLPDGIGRSAFSPDSRWLVTASASKYQFWHVGTWQAAHSIPRQDVPGGGLLGAGAMAFSPDGEVLAVVENQYRVKLVRSVDGGELATLEQPQNPAVVNWLAFDASGTKLACCCARDGLRLWDLSEIRRQLNSLGLDWQSASYPPPPSMSDKPLQIEQSGMNLWYLD